VSERGSEGGEDSAVKAGNRTQRRRHISRLSDLIPMDINHSVNLNPKPVCAHPLLAHKPHAVPTRKGVAATRQLSLAPSF